MWGNHQMLEKCEHVLTTMTKVVCTICLLLFSYSRCILPVLVCEFSFCPGLEL